MASFITKYSIGDTAYTVDSIIYVHTVSKVTIEQTATQINVTYGLAQVPGKERTCGRQNKTEIGLFSTKQEAGEAWMKNNGLDCGISSKD